MVRLDFSLIERTKLIGYSPLEAKDLAAKIAAGCKPSQLPGDFVLIIEGKRQNWKPRPIEILDLDIDFLNRDPFKDKVLANAFIIENIPYMWKKGKLEQWK